ncbi:hypothetical protein DPMN_084367 [Dreissena polymorpha]|uniref:Uncharacterized protein n=1 Tax=Dreissena polymorpha TaxID=45954 RepID=A0A9D3YD01_DREPO|nr:hypothetical protein DPMN_084367 [Dreissena polymorpha]
MIRFNIQSNMQNKHTDLILFEYIVEVTVTASGAVVTGAVAYDGGDGAGVVVIISIKLLTKFGEDRMPGMAHIKRVTKFGLKRTKIPRDIIQLLTKFGEDWMNNT